MLGKHGAIHAGMQANLNDVGVASLLDDARTLAIDVAHVVDIVKAVANLGQIIIQRMRDTRLAPAAKDYATHLGTKELGMFTSAQELDDLVIGIQVLDHNERLVGAQRKEARKVHRTVGSDLDRLHADALFGHTPDQALAMLAVKSLFVIEDLVGALAARGNRSISTAVLLDPSLDDRNFLGNLAIGHLVVLSALWSLLAVLALDLNDLGLLFLNFGERRGRGDDLEQLPAQNAGQGKRRNLAMGSRLSLLGSRICCGRLGLLLRLALGIALGIALAFRRRRLLLRTPGLVFLLRLALGLLHRSVYLCIFVARRHLLSSRLSI